jgi:hypothetical protein
MKKNSVLRKMVILGIIGALAALAQDPLPSWEEGPAKQAIVAFVGATTDKANPNFVPPEERIATFDQDGTLWVSHPVYTQVMFCLDRVPAVVKAKPELAKVEPFMTVLSGNREAMAKLSMKDLEKILAATLTGMSVEEFSAEAQRGGSRRPGIRAGSGLTPSSPSCHSSRARSKKVRARKSFTSDRMAT